MGRRLYSTVAVPLAAGSAGCGRDVTAIGM
jgi:hypothetical protein